MQNHWISCAQINRRLRKNCWDEDQELVASMYGRMWEGCRSQTEETFIANKWILHTFRRHSTRCTLAFHVDRIIPSPSSVIDNRLLGDGILSVFDEEKGTTNFWYNRRIECYVLLTRFIEDSKVGIRMWLLNTLWLAALYESVQT